MAKIHHFGALSGICMAAHEIGDEEALAEWQQRTNAEDDPSARRRWADRAIRALDRLDG